MFELISKMYSEMKQGFASVDKRFDSLEKDVVLLENNLKPEVKTALDGYKLVFEKLTTLEEKVDIIDSKVEKQDVEIRVIKAAK